MEYCFIKQCLLCDRLLYDSLKNWEQWRYGVADGINADLMPEHMDSEDYDHCLVCWQKIERQNKKRERRLLIKTDIEEGSKICPVCFGSYYVNYNYSFVLRILNDRQLAMLNEFNKNNKNMGYVWGRFLKDYCCGPGCFLKLLGAFDFKPISKVTKSKLSDLFVNQVDSLDAKGANQTYRAALLAKEVGRLKTQRILLKNTLKKGLENGTIRTRDQRAKTDE